MTLFFLLSMVTFFLFKINYIFRELLKDSQNFFMQSSPRYQVCLFSVLSKARIVDIEYPQGMCSRIFVVEEFSGLFEYLSIFLIKDSVLA